MSSCSCLSTTTSIPSADAVSVLPRQEQSSVCLRPVRESLAFGRTMRTFWHLAETGRCPTCSAVTEGSHEWWTYCAYRDGQGTLLGHSGTQILLGQAKTKGGTASPGLKHQLCQIGSIRFTLVKGVNGTSSQRSTVLSPHMHIPPTAPWRRHSRSKPAVVVRMARTAGVTIRSVFWGDFRDIGYEVDPYMDTADRTCRCRSSSIKPLWQSRAHCCKTLQDAITLLQTSMLISVLEILVSTDLSHKVPYRGRERSRIETGGDNFV